VSAIQKTTHDLHLPPSIAASFQGSAQAFQSSLSSTPILILAALVAIYLILGTLYESTIIRSPSFRPYLRPDSAPC
jgi:multidrug efflux pump subunit AcrB